MQASLLRSAGLASRACISKGLPNAARLTGLHRLGSRGIVRAFREEDEAKQASKQDKTLAPHSPANIAHIQSAPQSETVPYMVEDFSQILAPAFTRRREHFVGRAAMLGVAAMWAGEVMTGLGPMSQLAGELHVPVQWAFWATAGLALFQLVNGLNKGSPTFSPANQRDVARRSKGLLGITTLEPDTRSRISPTQEPRKFFLRWELTLGRTAMLIFAAAMIFEYAWGGESPLAHSGFISAGLPLVMAPLWLKLGVGLFGLGGLGVFSAFNNSKDPDTY